ncbi:hypothetical protein MTR67_018355 [Solanum verrucosum]|uniref:Uncharacterized protein n=1 Tax=Solanum verrucosum TaxID=315347 RepID=A0AAF0TSZ3_SOLVR|nr:hypothetical protein MTR67_018355 [Solanum verrucosum]
MCLPTTRVCNIILIRRIQIFAKEGGLNY